MGRTARDQNDRYRVKPVTKIELSEKHKKLRAILAIAFLGLALGTFAVILFRLLSEDPGWKTVEYKGSENPTCAEEFVFLYRLGMSEESPTAEYKRVQQIFSDAAEDAYRMFDASPEGKDDRNVRALNAHVNEVCEISPYLYRSLEKLEKAGDRSAFCAPIAANQYNLAVSNTDEEAAAFDPRKNEESAAYVRALAAFAADPDAVSIRLVGENRAVLAVSDAYLAYAEEDVIDTYFDFGWMKNAFIVDYLAEALQSEGYTHGTLTSYDGFSRNLDESGEEYSFNLFDRPGTTAMQIGSVRYTGARSIVFLRAYPLNDSFDFYHYYTYRDGTVRTPYLDPTDGLDRCSVPQIAAASEERGCADVLLAVRPFFVAPAAEEAFFDKLPAEGIDCILIRNGVIRYSEEDLTFGEIAQNDTVSYKTEKQTPAR